MARIELGRVHGPKRPIIIASPEYEKVQTLAHAEADRLQHPFLGTEHLLLGLVNHGLPVLEAHGIRLNPTRTLIEEIYKRGNAPVSGRLLTPGVLRARELAQTIAERSHHDKLIPDHLFWGVINGTPGIAIDVIKGIGGNESIENIRLALQLQFGQ